MSAIKFVERSARYSIKNIDRSAKNKFKWSWLEDTDKSGVYLSDYIRKTDRDDIAFCTLCSDEIRYGSSGQSVRPTAINRGES